MICNRRGYQEFSVVIPIGLPMYHWANVLKALWFPWLKSYILVGRKTSWWPWKKASIARACNPMREKIKTCDIYQISTRKWVIDQWQNWRGSYRRDQVMNQLLPPKLCQHNPENGNQLAKKDCGIRGDQVIVHDCLDVWVGRVVQLCDMMAPKLGLVMLIQA